MNAPVPPHEVERLQTLHDYNILDTPPETAFERITTMAARLFNVPIVLVSPADADRQWFKSCFGLDTRQTSRELSFCAYAILSDEVMVVPDALSDPRFINNGLVTGPPYIRAYMGAPLKTPNGQNLGSLCLIDTVPRQFSAEQQDTLANLAAIVVDELVLRRTARELRASEQKNSVLAAAVAKARSGVIITDPQQPDNPIIFVNAAFSALSGYPAAEIIGRNCRFLQGPDTAPADVQMMRAAIAETRAYQGLLINYRKDGTPFINELSFTPVVDQSGALLNFVGLQQDVTEREMAKQLLEQRVRERTEDLAQSQIEILNRLARAAEFRDDETGRHTQRVAQTVALLAQALGLAEAEVTHARQAAPLHDVGKIAISDLILLKPDKLTDDEFAVMKTHAARGAALLAEGRSEVVRVAEQIAGTHHERWDGTGYPNQLAGEQIPLEGRILAVADVFDALTHERPYKKAWPVAEAVSEIVRQSGHHFDPQVVAAFLKLPHADLV